MGIYGSPSSTSSTPPLSDSPTGSENDVSLSSLGMVHPSLSSSHHLSFPFPPPSSTSTDLLFPPHLPFGSSIAAHLTSSVNSYSLCPLEYSQLVIRTLVIVSMSLCSARRD